MNKYQEALLAIKKSSSMNELMAFIIHGQLQIFTAVKSILCKN